MANTNRTKGHALERKITNIFKQWFPKARTSRQASRLLDDSKVDLAFIPYNVQCKKGYPKGINYPQLFQDMEDGLKENFPEDDKQVTYPKVIVHEKGRKKYERLIVMQEEEFFALLNKMYSNDKN